MLSDKDQLSFGDETNPDHDGKISRYCLGIVAVCSYSDVLTNRPAGRVDC